jgi:hypothetical protein
MTALRVLLTGHGLLLLALRPEPRAAVPEPSIDHFA